MWSRDVRRRTRKNKVVGDKVQAAQRPLSFFCFVFFSKKRKWVPRAKPLVAVRRRRRSVKKTCQWQVFSVGHACFTGMVLWFLLICKGEFSAPLKRGRTLAGGSPFHVVHYKRGTTQRCVVLLLGCTTPTSPQSAYADSSLCTREPWVSAVPR